MVVEAPVKSRSESLALAVLLAGVIFVTHFGSDWAGTFYREAVAAGKAWFYMLRGMEGLVLFAIIAALKRHPAVTAVCLVGMFEEGMTTACRASKPIAEAPAVLPFSGLCGDDWYRVGLTLLGLSALGILYELGRLYGKKGS